MKMVIIEPLGVPKEKLLEMAKDALQDKVEVVYYDTRTTDIAELIERGKDADIIVEANLPLNADVINGFEKCRLLSVAFTGIDHVAVDACRAKNIMICNCAGYSNAAVSELVFGLLIGFYRNIAACDSATRAGGTKDGLVGPELEGKKFGVIGTGAIGSKVAALANAFGCQVYAYSRTEKKLANVQYVDLDTLLSTCDIVSLHVPSNAETKHLISAEKIGLMKPSAVLVNCARGPVVDNEALAAALNADKIAGACIDVFDMEPPIPADYPLLNCRNTLLTPHVAFATDEAMVKRAVIVFQNVIKFIEGDPQNVM